MPEAQVAISSPPATSLPTIIPAPAPGRPFNVAFDGDVITGTIALRTVRDIERLIKVLNAQKSALEAMQDEPDEYDVDLARDANKEMEEEEGARH
jgi:hypothetical protein